MNEGIRVGGVAVEITFKEIQNLHLSVHPPLGRVTISAPLHVDLETIRVYVTTRLAWIRKAQQKLQAQPRETQKCYLTRESHWLFGMRYLLKLTPTARPRVVLHHSTLELQVPETYSEGQKEDLLYRFYRQVLRKKLQKLVTAYAQKMGLDVPLFGIRTMKSKWGSCSVARRYVWFNVELAKKPVACIEYVVVHELAHLLERTHTPAFFQILQRYLPGWEVRKQQLNNLSLPAFRK